MKKTYRWVSALIITALFFSYFQVVPSAQAWHEKIDPWVLDKAAEGEAEFLVFLNEQADLSGAAGLQAKLDKGTYVYESLTDVARRTQGPVLQSLKEMGVAGVFPGGTHFDEIVKFLREKAAN